eukprot:7687887-Pyramimonas_sp.AAC.1
MITCAVSVTVKVEELVRAVRGHDHLRRYSNRTVTVQYQYSGAYTVLWPLGVRHRPVQIQYQYGGAYPVLWPLGVRHRPVQ